MTSTTTDRRRGVNASQALKVPCKVATSANITLSGEQTVDGVACTAGDRVLVKSQTDAKENGIYEVDTSAWNRAPDWDGTYDVVQGTIVRVHSGSTQSGFWEVATSGSITPGTTEVTLSEALTTVATIAAFAQTLLDDADADAFWDTLMATIDKAGARSDFAVPGTGTTNTFTRTQTWSKGIDVASTGALVVGDDGNYFDITGTTSITSIGAKGVGTVIKLHFDDVLTLTHHATDLILPGGANITTAAGDEAEFIEYATGDWRCTNYIRATGVVSKSYVDAGDPNLETATDATNGGANDLTEINYTGIKSGAKRIAILFDSVSLSGTDEILVQIGDSGGVETTSYVSTSTVFDQAGGSSGASSTSGYVIRFADGTRSLSGSLTLFHFGSNKWISNHTAKLTTTNVVSGAGDKTLSGELDRVKITVSGTNTFDGGEVNILVE